MLGRLTASLHLLLDHGDGLYRVTIGGLEHHAPSVVLATGGLSIPKMGATGFALDIARRFGLPVVQTRPALVPFTLGEDEALMYRAALSLNARVCQQLERTIFPQEQTDGEA